MLIRKNKYYLIFMVFILLIALWTVPSFKEVVYASNAKELQNQIVTNKVKIDFEVGYDNVIRIGRTSTFTAKVEGLSSKFSGTLRITYQDAQDRTIQYEKEFSIKKKEELEIIFQIKLLSEDTTVHIKLLNDKNEVLEDIDLVYDLFEYENQPMIGVLTQDLKTLSYLSAFGSEVYNLNTSDHSPEYISYDMMDIIVIDDFDLYEMSESQFGELLRFVEQGGIIALGTGENYEKVLKRFVDEDIFRVESKEVRNEKLDYRINKDYEKELIARVVDKKFIDSEYTNTIEEKTFFIGNVSDSTHVAYLNDILLMESYQYGIGNFEIFHIGLGYENLDNLFSLALLDYMLDYMNMNRKDQLTYEMYGHLADYNLYQAISNSETDNIPSVGKFIVAIIIYILVVGPIAYLVLRILDKRKYLWVVVPVLSILFTAIMYSLGSETRIETLYACYFNVVKLDGSNEATESSVLNLSTPDNGGYSLELPFTSYFGAINNDYYSYGKEVNHLFDEKVEDYHRKITYNGDGLLIELQGYKAFSPVFFEAYNKFQLDYNYEANLRYNYIGIEGEFVNDLGFSLEQAVLFCGNHIVSLGTIEDKETITVTGKPSFAYQSRDSYSAYNFISEVVKEDSILLSNQKRMIAALTYALEKYSIGNENESFIVGFTNATFDGSLIETFSNQIGCYGNQLIILPVGIDYQVGESILVPTIDPYLIDGEGTDIFAKNYRYMEDVLIQDYQLPKEDKIESLYYLESKNQPYDEEYYQGFTGEVYAFNRKTKEYDLIFNESQRVCMNVEDYLDDNKIILKYKPDSGVLNYVMTLPFISYTKEAN